MVTTLISANQNSISPNSSTAIKLHDVEDDQGYQRRDPLGHSGKPVMDVDAHGGDLRHADDHPHEPVGPPGHESGPRSDELFRVGGEGPRDRPIEQQLAESAHDEEDHHSTDRVGHHQARAGLLDRPGRAEKQPHADRPADGDHLDVPVLEPTMEILLLRATAPHRVACPHWSQP